MSDLPNTDPYIVARTAGDRIAELTGGDHHDVAVVLGSGWGPAVDLIGDTVSELDVTELPRPRAGLLGS